VLWVWIWVWLEFGFKFGFGFDFGQNGEKQRAKAKLRKEDVAAANESNIHKNNSSNNTGAQQEIKTGRGRQEERRMIE